MVYAHYTTANGRSLAKPPSRPSPHAHTQAANTARSPEDRTETKKMRDYTAVLQFLFSGQIVHPLKTVGVSEEAPGGAGVETDEVAGSVSPRSPSCF